MKRPFVLVHGAFHGGWCWSDVAALLRMHGHAVFAPSLTGLADRSHLASAAITLETHILDICNLIEWEDLRDVVLCGHSYGGMVIGGVADRMAEGRIASLVFLDAILPRNGWALTDYPLPRNAEGKGFGSDFEDGLVHPPDPAAFGVPDRLMELVRSKITPQPLGTFTEPLAMTRGFEHISGKTFALCTRSAGLSELQRGADHARKTQDWHFCQIETGHDAMLEAPDLVADLLLKSA